MRESNDVRDRMTGLARLIDGLANNESVSVQVIERLVIKIKNCEARLKLLEAEIERKKKR